MAKQQPEGVYLYINDSGERFITIVDAFGIANMLPWMQPGQTDNIIEKSWNLTGDFINHATAEKPSKTYENGYSKTEKPSCRFD